VGGTGGMSNLIQKIAKITGDNYISFNDTKAGRRECLGWLKEKETLIAVFGEKKSCGGCTSATASISHMSSCKREWEGWQYHAQEMGYTLEEVLNYYAGYGSNNYGRIKKTNI
jgi:hypothetical protein